MNHALSTKKVKAPDPHAYHDQRKITNWQLAFAARQ
jgi:hypothetical protein